LCVCVILHAQTCRLTLITNRTLGQFDLVYWAHTWSCLPYILAYKPTIFGWILTLKLWGSAYTWVMPHSCTLTARISMVWTISWPQGLCVCMGACAAEPLIDCCGCLPVKSFIV